MLICSAFEPYLLWHMHVLVFVVSCRGPLNSIAIYMYNKRAETDDRI